MRGLFLGVAAGLVLSGMADVRAETEPSTIAPGGGKSPVTGGRPDKQSPQLGPGNRVLGNQAGL